MQPQTFREGPSAASSRRLTRRDTPDWARYIDTLDYNMPAWNASNWLVKYNLKTIHAVQHIQDFECGKRSDAPPFTLPELIDPKRSPCEDPHKSCIDRVRHLFDSMKRYEPGHAPAHNYEPAFGTARVLILLLKKCADYYGRLPHEQQLSRSLDALYDAQHFVQEPSNTRLSRQEYDTRLDMICEKLVASFVENSLLFETIFERRARAARDKRSRKGTGRKGTRTAYMERQLETFQTFILDGHPVSGRERAATRAHQCWILHREEWDAHVHAKGEEKGFTSYKSLARAYQNS